MTTSPRKGGAAGRPRREGRPEAPWCTGHAQFLSLVLVKGAKLIVAVRCRFGAAQPAELTLLDTGAEWSMVGGALAEALVGEADPMDEALIMRTHIGTVAGHLYRLPVTLLADEGDALTLPGTVLLAPAWPGPPVLGYRGFLERLRFGFDPGTGPAGQWLSFGAAS